MITDQNITDYDIQALVDNELPWEEEKRIRAYITSNPDAHERYKELCRQRALLKDWWKKSNVSQ